MIVDTVLKSDFDPARVQIMAVNETVYRCIIYQNVNGKQEVFANGTIKWDGCSDWSYANYVHYCGFGSIQHYAHVMQCCYHMVAEHMPKYDGLGEEVAWPEGYERHDT